MAAHPSNSTTAAAWCATGCVAARLTMGAGPPSWWPIAIDIAIIVLASLLWPRLHRHLQVVAGSALLLWFGCQAYVGASLGQLITIPMMRYALDAGAAGLDPRGIVAAAICVVVLIVVAVIGRRVAGTTKGTAGVVMITIVIAAATGTTAHSPFASLWSQSSARGDGEPWQLTSTAMTAHEPITLTRPPKHVVVWLQESTAWGETSFAGGADTTPRLATLAAEQGVVVDDFHAVSPISIKTIASLMCGVFPLPDGELETQLKPRIDCDSLPEVMARHGFASALLHGGYFAFTDKLALLEDRGFQTLVDGENHPQRSTSFTNGWGIDDAALLTEARSFLDAHADESTLLVIITLFPHHEYFLPPQAPKPFGQSSLHARYQNGLRYEDALLGELVTDLQRRGTWNDTVLLWMGDHGEAFDQHPNNRQHGNAIYVENTHTPLVILSPLLTDPGSQRHTLSTHADILPTVAEWLSWPRGAHWQGASLASTVQERVIPLFTALPRAQAGIRTSTWSFIDDGQAPQLFAHSDAQQRRNVAAAHPQQSRELQQRAWSFVEQQQQWWRNAPALGPSYIDALGGAMQLQPVSARVYNMARRCLPFVVAAGSTLTMTLPTSVALPAMIGVGIDDHSRQRRTPSITVSVHSAGEERTTTLSADFDHCSQVWPMTTQRHPVRLTITSKGATGEAATSGCWWASPRSTD